MKCFKASEYTSTIQEGLRTKEWNLAENVWDTHLHKESNQSNRYLTTGE